MAAGLFLRRALHHGLAERRALHCDGNLRLHGYRDSHEALLDVCGRPGAGGDDDTDRGSHHGGVPACGSGHAARRRPGLRGHKWKTVATVVVRAAIRGIVTGIMLTLARVAGETAPLIFTAATNRFWSSGWNQPIASLPVMIYTYASGPYDDWHRQAWEAGLVLLALVLVANIGARLVVARGISFRQV